MEFDFFLLSSILSDVQILEKPNIYLKCHRTENALEDVSGLYGISTREITTIVQTVLKLRTQALLSKLLINQSTQIITYHHLKVYSERKYFP
jgi:hypothetical protein